MISGLATSNIKVGFGRKMRPIIYYSTTVDPNQRIQEPQILK